MPNDFNLADFRESGNAFAAIIFPERFASIDTRHVQRRQFKSALARRRLLENKSFVLIAVTRRFFDSAVQVCSCPYGTANLGCSSFPISIIPCSLAGPIRRYRQERLCYNGFSSARFRAPVNFSMSARVVVSVTHTSP